jgi:hypothetical protein
MLEVTARNYLKLNWKRKAGQIYAKTFERLKKLQRES